MPTLDLKATYKAVKDYFAALEEFHRLGVACEMAVRAAFQRLLELLLIVFIGAHIHVENPTKRHIQ